MPYRALFKHMRALFRPVVPGQETVFGDPAAVQDQLGGDRRPQRMLVTVVPGGEAFVGTFHQESADPLSFQARPDDGDVGDAAVGDPRLVSVQHETAAGPPRARPHSGRIRSEVGFGEAKAADGPPGLEPGQPVGSLLLAAETVDGIHDQGVLDRDEAAQPAVAPLQLLHDEAVAHRFQAGAVVTGQAGSEVAEASHGLHQFQRKGPGLEMVFDDGQDPFFDERPNAVSNQPFLLGEQVVKAHEIHVFRHGDEYSSPWRNSSRYSTVPAQARTALRFGHILPVCAPIAPCPAGAGTVSVLAGLPPRTASSPRPAAPRMPARVPGPRNRQSGNSRITPDLSLRRVL